MRNQKEVDSFGHFMWKKSLPKSAPNLLDPNLSSEEKDQLYLQFLIELGRKCDMLGINDPIELGLLNIQHFNTQNEKQIRDKFNSLGFPPELSEMFGEAKLSLIRPAIHLGLYPISLFSDYITGLNLNVNDDYLFDPYYGMLIIKKDGRYKNLSIAMGAFMKSILALPPKFAEYNLKNPIESLMVGVRYAQLVFKDLLPKDQLEKLFKDEVPEIVVNSQAELNVLIQSIKEKRKLAPGAEIWFRGQTTDHLMEDRSALAIAGILPYSNLRDSSFVPSLYRTIDSYAYDSKKYINLINHYGDWCLRAKLLFPERYVVKRDGEIIEDPSFDLPEGCNASISMSFSGKAEDESQIIDEMAPYSTWTITNRDGKVVDTFIKHHFPALASYQSNLLLQHYGCHTSALDITSDHNVAAWFATNKLTGEPDSLKATQYKWSEKNSPSEWPTIFVMALIPDIHPFLNSAKILRGTGALRPIRQSCGLLSGSGNLCRNYGARYISMKIRLSPNVRFKNMPTVNELFPDENEDEILKTLLDMEKRWGNNNNNFFPVSKVIY